MHGSESLRSK